MADNTRLGLARRQKHDEFYTACASSTLVLSLALYQFL